MSKIYVASPFFTKSEQVFYDKVITHLRSYFAKDEVFVPREHTIPDGYSMPNPLWAESVFAVDLVALQNCDAVVVLNFGLYSDSGTAWECGYAYAAGKKIINILCGGTAIEYSLMMLNGTNCYVEFNDFINGGDPWKYFVSPKKDLIEVEQK